ncbi:hypothetical protein B0T14DRAFT_280692 [Immersiella caudata]|uniref:ML-like domain-containing protein n=1 Tax=Immersiella caudata TaxID=314043 RepID=A0AA39WDP3_9PEZI|nr:hypothetical protein B0T14DRAFT_280692 [Immersiella caudata]
MKFLLSKPLAVLASVAALALPTFAEPILQSNSLNACQEESGFQASLFTVRFTPNNNTANVDIVAVSSIQGSVVFDISISAYGFEITRQKVNPCDAGLAGLCPMTAGKIPLNFNIPVSASAVKDVPGIAYTFPDLDAKVKVFINMTDGPQAGKSVACVSADISNGKTVDLLGVKWATALVAGLALTASAMISGLGHYNAASHVAANALSLFGYFQAQAMLGMTGVPLPPIVMSWTQDFQWSMGIIRVGFMQDIFTWYQRATGGTPSHIFDSLTTVSVQVEKRKRSLDLVSSGVSAGLGLSKRALAMMPRTIAEPVTALAKRANIQTDSGSYIVYGIQRVAFRAYIESTNLFMTGLSFFCIMVVFVSICVAAFKGGLEVAVKKGWMKSDNFLEFRNGWFTVLKGILFRMTLIGFPQLCVLCLWEFTQRDSAAEVVLAVCFLFGMIITLGWASSKVIMIARRSVAMHRNPAYILFSDPQALNKWGFLYVQFRASAYYFILPVLGYILIKSMFVAFGQHTPNAQAVGFIIVEAAALIGASVLRPWMDKKTNAFNIAICAMNFLNSIFLLIFTEVFNQPPLVTGVVGVVLWVANAAFSLVLLLMLIVTTCLVFFRENPDGRYTYMADDRTSFMKSQTHLTTTTELEALGATARGDKAGGYKPGLDLDDDAESISSDTVRRQAVPATHPAGYGKPPGSPADPAAPLFPVDRSPPRYNNEKARYTDRSPSPYDAGANLTPQFRQQNNSSPAGYRSQNNASPWQRGAGYEH